MKPRTISAKLLVTALTGISHHDPAVQDGSNVLTFNRNRQLVLKSPETISGIDQTRIDIFCQANEIPTAIADIVSGMKFPEFVATALICFLIDVYNSLDGTGLFSGMDRYRMLESRARTAAVKSSNLRSFWANLTGGLQLPVHGGKEDEKLSLFLSLPADIQFAVVNEIATNHRTIITVARIWHNQTKLQDEEYAKKAALLFDHEPLQIPSFSSEAIHIEPNMVLDVPAVSSNSLRHQMIREPGWEHLFAALDLQGVVLPTEAEAIFYNGGNIKAGAKQPMNSFALASKVKEAYPLLDLLGGTCDSFDLGESLLAVNNWLVCKENYQALESIAAHLPGINVSAFDLLDDVTHTRQATEAGFGPMIYNFETLIPGTQFVVTFSVKPFSSRLAIGALCAAIETYLENHPVIAGQSARGFGVVGAGWIEDYPPEFTECRAEYEKYLADNHDKLREQIIDGTLGCGIKVVS
jgi:hypothetical protein